MTLLCPSSWGFIALFFDFQAFGAQEIESSSVQTALFILKDTRWGPLWNFLPAIQGHSAAIKSDTAKRVVPLNTSKLRRFPLNSAQMRSLKPQCLFLFFQNCIAIIDQNCCGHKEMATWELVLIKEQHDNVSSHTAADMRLRRLELQQRTNGCTNTPPKEKHLANFVLLTGPACFLSMRRNKCTRLPWAIVAVIQTNCYYLLLTQICIPLPFQPNHNRSFSSRLDKGETFHWSWVTNVLCYLSKIQRTDTLNVHIMRIKWVWLSSIRDTASTDNPCCSAIFGMFTLQRKRINQTAPQWFKWHVNFVFIQNLTLSASKWGELWMSVLSWKGTGSDYSYFHARIDRITKTKARVNVVNARFSMMEGLQCCAELGARNFRWNLPPWSSQNGLRGTAAVDTHDCKPPQLTWT